MVIALTTFASLAIPLNVLRSHDDNQTGQTYLKFNDVLLQLKLSLSATTRALYNYFDSYRVF